MILTASDLAALKSSLECWEIVEYVSAATVLIGVIGEYVAEFTKFAAKMGIEKKLAKISTLILIVGLAVELLALVKTSQLSGRLVASLEDQSAQASARAAEATLELERLKQPRNLSKDQQVNIANTLKPFSGTQYRIGIPPSGLEPGSDLIQRLIDVLTDAGWELRPPPDNVLSDSDPRFMRIIGISGVKSFVHSSKMLTFGLAARALSDALNAAGIIAEAKTMDDKSTIDAIMISIGNKP